MAQLDEMMRQMDSSEYGLEQVSLTEAQCLKPLHCCEFCGKKTKVWCQTCGKHKLQAFYCKDTECQKNHWSIHKKVHPKLKLKQDARCIYVGFKTDYESDVLDDDLLYHIRIPVACLCDEVLYSVPTLAGKWNFGELRFIRRGDVLCIWTPPTMSIQGHECFPKIGRRGGKFDAFSFIDKDSGRLIMTVAADNSHLLKSMMDPRYFHSHPITYWEKQVYVYPVGHKRNVVVYVR